MTSRDGEEGVDILKSRALFGIDSGSSEAADLRKAWFNHVLIALEKLYNQVDELQTKVHNTNSSFYKDLMESRDSIRVEMENCRAGRVAILDKLEARFTKETDSLSSRIAVLEKSDLDDVLLTKLSKTKEALNTRIDELKEVAIMNKYKMGAILLVGGSAGGVLSTLAVALIKHLLSTP